MDVSWTEEESAWTLLMQVICATHNTLSCIKSLCRSSQIQKKKTWANRIPASLLFTLNTFSWYEDTQGLTDYSDHRITNRIHELASKKTKLHTDYYGTDRYLTEILFFIEDNIPGVTLIMWEQPGATSQTIQAWQSRQKTMKLLAYFHITEPSSFWTTSMCLV